MGHGIQVVYGATNEVGMGFVVGALGGSAVGFLCSSGYVSVEWVEWQGVVSGAIFGRG